MGWQNDHRPGGAGYVGSVAAAPRTRWGQNTHAPGGPALVVWPTSAPPGRIVFVLAMASGLTPRANDDGPSGAVDVFLCAGLGALDDCTLAVLLRYRMHGWVADGQSKTCADNNIAPDAKDEFRKNDGLEERPGGADHVSSVAAAPRTRCGQNTHAPEGPALVVRSPGYPAWTAPVIAKGLMYLRGKHELICYELNTD